MKRLLSGYLFKNKAWFGFLHAWDMQAGSAFFWLSLGVTLNLGNVGTFEPSLKMNAFWVHEVIKYSQEYLLFVLPETW